MAAQHDRVWHERKEALQHLTKGREDREAKVSFGPFTLLDSLAQMHFFAADLVVEASWRLQIYVTRIPLPWTCYAR